ncbi:MAG TPA: TlpA disulfide reductase family protein [Nitrospirota bacterium]
MSGQGSKKQVVFLVVLVLFVALVAVGYFIKDKKGKPAGSRIIAAGDRAPDFRLTASDGRQVSLSELRGRMVMVHFWATWCPPCVEELPTLDKLNSALAGTDFVLLAVNVDEGGVESVAHFLQSNRVSLPVLFDPGGRVAAQYGTFKLPETYIIDREGVVRYKVIGPRDWANPENIQSMRELVKAK